MPTPLELDLRLLELVRAVVDAPDPGFLSLYTEVCRQSATSGRRAHELVALSLKVSPRGLHTARYDAPIFWRPMPPEAILEAARRAAPTLALHEALGEPDSPVARWIADQGRFFTYLAVEHSSRVYKIYLFQTGPTPTLPEIDLDQPPELLRKSAYIRCLELDMDAPSRFDDTIYFKLEGLLEDHLAPGIVLHPRLGRALLDLPGRATVERALRGLLAGRGRPNAPVLKLRVPLEFAPEDLGSVRLALSQNLASPTAPLRVAEAAGALMEIGEALGQGPALARWLEAVAPFDPFISYLAATDDGITVYYKVGAAA